MVTYFIGIYTHRRNPKLAKYSPPRIKKGGGYSNVFSVPPPKLRAKLDNGDTYPYQYPMNMYCWLLELFCLEGMLHTLLYCVQ